MKKLIFLTLGLILFNSLAMAQVTTRRVGFRYDDSGNRYNRYMIVKIKSAETDIANESGENNEITDDLFESVKVFPNPVKDHLTIEIDVTDFDSFDCSLYNMNGALLKSITSNNSTYNIDFTQLAPGNYVLVLTVLDRKLQYKIIKN